MLGIELPLEAHQHALETVFFNGQGVRARYLIGAGEKKALQSLLSYFPESEEEIRSTFEQIKQIADDCMRIKRLYRQTTASQIPDMIGANLGMQTITLVLVQILIIYRQLVNLRPCW